MERAGKMLDAISMHYYTVPGPWENKGSATDFSADKYYLTLEKADHIEAVLEAHLAVMDRFDPKHRVGLIVDEWGTWFDVEPGTNPGFLYQQNTMRDAMVAALSLNIFNRHADRVVMANIAQMVNVLQAMILTDGDRMILTPTYHVFDLYRPHQNAQLLETAVFADRMENGLKQVSASASVKDPEKPLEVLLDVDGAGDRITGSILAGDPHDYNDFDAADRVAVRDFADWKQTEKGLLVKMPACAVAALTFRA